MRLPNRKPSERSLQKADPYMTASKLNELKQKLETLKKVTRLRAAEEVRRLAEMGDFSENAAYQIAKGRLRGINSSIVRLENAIKNALIIKPSTDGIVRLGSTVTVQVSGKEKTYQILGSSETNPDAGIISHTSPIGAALLGHQAGDTMDVRIGGREIVYKIVRVK